MTRLLQGAQLSCCALVVGIALGLFLTPYMVERLGDDAYAVYALASLFAGWCGLLDFGLTTTTSRYVSRYFARGDDESVNETGSTAIILFGAISGLVFLLAVGAYATASLLGERFDHTGLLGGALFFAGLSFATSKISDGTRGVINGALRQDLTGATALAFRILLGVVNFATLYFGGGVIALFVGNFLLTVAQAFVYIALTRRAAPSFRFSLRRFSTSRARSLFNYGFFAFLAQVGELATNRSDLVIIAVLLTNKEVARYNLVVVTLASYFNSFLYETSVWQTNWFATLAAKETSEEDENFKNQRDYIRLSDAFYESRAKIGRTSIYLAAFLALGLLALGEPFIERWIGEKYLDAFPALVVWCVAAGLYRGSAETNARLLQGLARHRILAYAAILCGILNVVLSVLFVKLGLGLSGVALGTALPCFVVHFFWIPNEVCRLVAEPKREYWTRQIKTTFVALLACLVPYSAARTFAAPEYSRLTLLAFVVAILYWGAIYAIGLNRNERAFVRGKFVELTRKLARKFALKQD